MNLCTLLTYIELCCTCVAVQCTFGFELHSVPANNALVGYGWGGCLVFVSVLLPAGIFDFGHTSHLYWLAVASWIS
jgi:hypothetical protein